ncbi:YueI family protein [Anaerobacillus sp. CMMVII]|uniref:YueI family protein n=1 Tax=Anaerobacillus sp. CMMVII TaxID=2755588 RepID=UPI0021B7FAEF|nr:YueI family protein [Anaerobacillus sp. CMMVII]
MQENKLHDILFQGIHGRAETLPEERALFLSTISERIYLALTNKQVIHKGMYPEALEVMRTKKDIHLFINGKLSYHLYSNYLKEASKYRIPFTVVNDGHDTPIGLVLASQTAVNSGKDYTFFVEDDTFQRDMGKS